MAALKLFVIALLATFAVQVLAVEQSKAAVELSEAAAYGIFEDAINKLLALVDGAVAELTENLGGVIDKVLAFANGVLGNVGKLFEGIFKQLDGLEKKAEELGKNITECLAPNKVVLEKMRDEAIASGKACGDAGVAAAKAAMEKGKGKLPDLKVEADKLIAEWKACNSILCKPAIIAKVGVVTAQSAVKIATVIAGVALDFVSITTTAATCTAGIIPGVTKHSAEIVKTIFECANKIISG